MILLLFLFTCSTVVEVAVVQHTYNEMDREKAIVEANLEIEKAKHDFIPCIRTPSCTHITPCLP